MTYKTVGSGGDYSDWNLALQSILNNGVAPDNIDFIQISDVHDTHVSLSGYGFCYLENFIVRFLNPDKYKTYLESVNGGLYFFFTTMGFGLKTGIVVVDGLDIISSNNQSVDSPCMYLRNGDSLFGIKIIAKNNRINGNGNARCGLQFYTQAAYGSAQKYDIYNNRIGGIENYTGSRCLYGYMNGSPIANPFIFVENNSIIRPPKGLGIVNTVNDVRVDYKNNAVCCSAENDGGDDWSSILSNSVVNNCADSDDSLVVGSNNVHDVTENDLVSVDPTSDNFLKLSLGSKLHETGTTDVSAWNTNDFRGNARPNANGLVSIGAHEPLYVNVTLRARFASTWASKTKPVLAG
jgi:hypothetical protein